LGRRDKAIIATKFEKFIDECQNIFGSYPDERALIDNIRNEKNNDELTFWPFSKV